MRTTRSSGPDVERVLSQVASRGGRRLKLRYPGAARNNAWLKNRTAALNLRNLISCGLPRYNGCWPDHPLRPGYRGLLASSSRACQAGSSGKSDHAADPKGPGLLPHRRPCRRSSRPRPAFIQCAPSHGWRQWGSSVSTTPARPQFTSAPLLKTRQFRHTGINCPIRHCGGSHQAERLSAG